MPPPPFTALFPEIVLSITVKIAWLVKLPAPLLMPPPKLEEVLFDIVLLMTVSFSVAFAETLFEIPLPLFPDIKLFLIVALPAPPLMLGLLETPPRELPVTVLLVNTNVPELEIPNSEFPDMVVFVIVKVPWLVIAPAPPPAFATPAWLLETVLPVIVREFVLKIAAPLPANPPPKPLPDRLFVMVELVTVSGPELKMPPPLPPLALPPKLAPSPA